MTRTFWWVLVAAAVLVACGDDGGAAVGTDTGGGDVAAADAPAADVGDQVPGQGAPPAGAVVVRVLGDGALAEVDERFLSVAVDTSQVVGGHWWAADASATGTVGASLTDPFDFERPRLQAMARELAPAYLRIGGSEADAVWYDVEGSGAVPPEGYEFTFSRQRWEDVMTFADAMGYRVFFTLNSGPAARDEERRWIPDQARALLELAAERDDPVDVWELGNEINAYPLMHGLDWGLTGAEYAADMAALRALVDEITPGVLVAGPSSAYWPVMGEMNPILGDFLAAGGGGADVVTWHYYPQQSQRCPLQSRLAGPNVLLDPENLAELDQWAADVETRVDEHAAGTEIWLGESGNAQCGGAPGVSDAFVGSLWWLDELGRLARRGHRVVVRQTLSGSNYGLIHDETLTPRPDYWASVLWKRLMGTTALDVDLGEASDTLLAYAHCRRDMPGSVSVVLLNLSQTASATVAIAGSEGLTVERWHMTADELASADVALNGETLALGADDGLPSLEPARLRASGGNGWLELPPASYAFVTAPLGAAACQ